MKRLSILLVMVAPLVATAQDAPDYAMFETNYLKPLPDKSEEFGEALANHNKTFHQDGPYQAIVAWVVNGERTGQIKWIMGPTTFTHLDNRPNDDAHTDDWLQNVMSLTDGSSYTEYWVHEPDMSYNSDGVFNPIVRVRYIDVTRDEGYRFRQLIMKIREVQVQKNYPQEWNVYRNRLWTDDGRDWAFVTSFNSWSEMDHDRRFAADYPEVHGVGSWDQFLEEWEDVVDGAYDEFRQLIPEMSGATVE